MAKRWSPNEDAILRHEVQSCEEASSPVSWAQIAERLPGRSNKDCRKRWAKIDGRWHRGGWSESEDAKLRVAVACHGTRWAMVSEEVGTRNPDQCHKRWRNALSLDLDRSVWTTKDDECLLEAVKVHGRNWSPISQKYFPNRSPLELSNRYSSLSERTRPQSLGESSQSGRQENSSTHAGSHVGSDRSRHDLSPSMSTLDFHLNHSTQQSRRRFNHRFTLGRSETSDRETALTALGQLSPSSSEPTTQGSSPCMLSNRVTAASDDTQMLEPGFDVLRPPWPAHLPDPGFSGSDESGILQLNWMQGIEDAAIPHALDGGLDVASFLRDMPTHSTPESPFSRLSAELHLDGGVMGNALCRVSPNSDVDTSGYASHVSPSEIETALSTRCPTEDIPLVRVGRGNHGENRVDNATTSTGSDRGVTLVLENLDRDTYNDILGVLYDRRGGGSSVRVVVDQNP